MFSIASMAAISADSSLLSAKRGVVMTSGVHKMDKRLATALMECVHRDMIQVWRRLGLPMDEVVSNAWEPRIAYIDREVATMSHRIVYDIFVVGETQPYHRREILVTDRLLESG